jgi:hypothetical protein
MAGNSGPNIVNDGLVLYLDAGNKDSYSGTGNIWNDLSGKGYNATLINSPTFSNGAIQFRAASSTSGHAVCTFNEGVLKTDSTSWTIETFFKYISIPSSDESVVIGRAGCHGGIYLYSNNGIYHAIKTNECWVGAVHYGVVTMVTNTTYHSVMTYNSNGVVKSYSNGQYITTSTFNKSSYDFFGYGDTFYIGGIPSGGPPQAYSTNTDISIVKCYNRELSDTEILQNYNSNKSRFGLP